MTRKLRNLLVMLLVSSLIISNINPITVSASGSDGKTMDTDELVFITLADNTDYRWNANGNGDQGNVIHLDTVKGSNCKFKLKKVVDKDGNVSNDDTKYYGIKFIRDAGTDRFADIEDKSQDDGKKLHLWESDDNKVKGNEHRQFAFYLAKTDSYGNECYYIQNRNSGLWLGVEDTNESGKCDKGDKIIQTTESNRKQWIISKAVVPKCGKEAEDIIAAGQKSAFVEIFQKNTIHAINRISDKACKGTQLHLYDVGTSSKWRIDWDATYSAYTIHAVTGGEKDRGSAFTDGGVVWDVSGEDGEKVHLWDEQSKSENQNTSQFWRFIKQDDGSYKIQNARSGLYLALKDDDSNECFVLSDKGMQFEISAFADQTTPINDVNFAYATNWMEKIPNDVSLSSVNIPGTHDTGTASIWEDSWAQVSWTKCQKLYYGEQLNVGARSFDIRCNATKDDASPSDVMIIHGGEKPQCYNRDDSNLTLKDILDDSVRFLEEHSSEALIMTVKQDAGSASGLVHAMSEFIKANKKYVYTGNGIPSMGEARGKIVFMRRYAIDEEVYNGVEKSWFGLDLTNWDNFNYMKNTYALSIYDKDNVSVFVQDAFKADAYDEKRDYIEGTMKQTVGENKDAPKIPADAWVYNYVSTAGIGGIEWPLTQTRGINPWLYEDEINCIDNRRLGMVMMNYIDAPMARLIYETNFKDGNFFATKTTLPTTVTVTCGQGLGEAKITGSYPYGGKWRFDGEDYIPTWEDFNNGEKFSMTYYSGKEKRRSQTAEVAITDFVKNNIDVTVDSKEITYGDTTPKLTFTCDEGKLQGEDTTEALKITLSIEPKATGKDGRLKAGTWKIQAVSDSENYNVSFTEGTIKVNPKTVNATWSDTTNLKCNGKPQKVTADLTGVLEGDDCTPAVTGGNAVGPSWSGEVGDKPEKYTANLSLTGEDAGNYQLAEGCESKSYYILREQPREGEYQFPEKAVLTYGQTLSEATLIGASGAGKFVFVDKDKKTVIGDTKPTAAGTYKSEYYLAFVPENNQEGMVVNSEPTTVEVQKKEIKIIIKDNSRVYGSTKTSPYSFSIAEGDDENSFGTGSFDANYESDNSLGIKLSAGEGEELSANAGTYPITVQSCSNTNYKVTAVPGTLTVMKRPISLGWNCESTYSYTGNPVDITCEVASVNVQFGDYEKSPCTFRVFCNQKVEVGYYKAFAIITNANYTYNAGNALDNGCYYEIVKADPDVTFPSEISLTYGQTLSQAEFTGADSKGIPGEFKIKEETSDSSLLTPSDSGKELEVQFVPQDTKNYNVISKKIPLKVSKKTIVVRAEDQKQMYGDEIAEFAWSMDESQLVGDDKKEDFAFTLTAKKGGSDVSDAIPDAGLYEISISCDEGKSVAETIQKYAFDFRQGSLEISPRVAEIQWSDTTCIMKGGNAPSATIANLVAEDVCEVTVESDGTEKESYDVATKTWTPYTAKITGLSGTDKFNYSLSANEEDLEISYYVLADENDYVMPTEAYLTYGQKRSEVKWSAMAGKGEFLIVDRKTNFRVDDDTILSAGEYNDYAVRFYPDSSEGLESDMGYSEITLYVEKKELTVNALPVEKTYGEETKLDFTVDASKLVGEDTKADLGVVLTAIGTSGSEEEKIDGNRINSPVGTYDITMAQCNSANYDVTVVSSMLTIHPKEVSLSWSDVSNLVYSGNPVNVTAKAEGILEGDTCEVKVSNGQKIEPRTYRAIAVSLSNSNYTLPTDLDMLVKEYTIRATPDLNGLPTVAERVYHPNAPLKDDELTGGNVLDIEGNTLVGTWSWKEQNTIPTVGNDGYEAVFTPSDENLEYRYATITKTIAVPVKKATPYISSKPVAAAITYGQSLEASKLSGGMVLYGTGTGQAATGENAEDVGNTPVAGKFAWKDATVKPVVADSDKTAYTVVFTPTNKNYNTVEKEITVTVNKADAPQNKPDNTMNVDYSKEKVSDITLPEGWAWQDAYKEKTLTVGTAVAATAVYTGADKENYETESVEISITRLECTHATTEVKNAKDATCTEKGYIGDTYCKDCGVKLADGTEIAMTDHKWDAGKVTKEPTETAEGVKTYTCSFCGKTKTEAIPKKTATTQELPKKGDVVADDKASVTVEVTDVAKKEVEYKEPANKKAKTVSIPAIVKVDGVTYKVTKVDDNAFKNNKTVTKVTVGSNITTIGKNAFSGATKLKTVKIGKNVTTIGSNAFKGCSSLTSVTLPSKATKIGANAFSGCKKLKTIKITSTKLTSKTVSKNAFKGLTKATTIKVPKKKLSAYKKLFKQKGLSSKVKVKGY